MVAVERYTGRYYEHVLSKRMNLDWEEKTVGEHLIHAAVVDSAEENSLKEGLGECVEKATSFLHLNIHDDSMYFMLGWDKTTSTLKISVVDETKSTGSQYVVTCCFSALAQELLADSEGAGAKADDQANAIRYWIKDYLTTCSSYYQYSLVASFYTESWKKADLL